MLCPIAAQLRRAGCAFLIRAEPRTSMVNRPSAIALFLRDIRVEHTLFALPFAYVGAVMAARGVPTWWQLLWITLAVVGARTAAMAANRYFDKEMDAANPRTAKRAVASGKLPPAVMLWAIGLGLALLVLSAVMLNPLCVKLLPLAALGAIGYPLCKRFTWTVHFVLGAVDACAPLGAYVAVAGTIDTPALLLFLAVTVWVAGFDILYALMDLKFDLANGVRSFPQAFGERSARAWPVLLHGVMVLALLEAGVLARAGWLYYAGVVLAAAVTAYEQRLIALAKDVFALNDRVFLTNMAFSVGFLGTTLASYVAR
jgi:4-hydroxybenzoate polyprenyltransferase